MDMTTTSNNNQPFLSASITQIDQQRRAFEERLHQACDSYVRTLFDFTLGPELATTDYPACHQKMQSYMNTGTAAIKATLDEVAIYLLKLDRRNLPPMLPAVQQPLFEEKENLGNDENSNESLVLHQQQQQALLALQPLLPPTSSGNCSSSSYQVFNTPSNSFSFTSPASTTVSDSIPTTATIITQSTLLTPKKNTLPAKQFRLKLSSPESKRKANENGGGFKKQDTPLLPSPFPVKRSVLSFSYGRDGNGENGSGGGGQGVGNKPPAKDLMAHGSNCTLKLKSAGQQVLQPFLPRPASPPPSTLHQVQYSCPLSIGCRPIFSRTKLRKHLQFDHSIKTNDLAVLLRKAVKHGGVGCLSGGSGNPTKPAAVKVQFSRGKLSSSVPKFSQALSRKHFQMLPPPPPPLPLLISLDTDLRL